MSTINNVFPQPDLSKTEEELLVQIYTNPVVQKHLRILASESAKELLSVSLNDTEDKEVVKMHCKVQGKLSVLATLLSIQSPEVSS